MAPTENNDISQRIIIHFYRERENCLVNLSIILERDQAISVEKSYNKSDMTRMELNIEKLNKIK